MSQLWILLATVCLPFAVAASLESWKDIEHILIATHGGEAGVSEVFRVLQNRLRDSTWTIAFKALIVVHLLIREGRQDAALKYLSSNPQIKLAINNFTEGTYPPVTLA